MKRFIFSCLASGLIACGASTVAEANAPVGTAAQPVVRTAQLQSTDVVTTDNVQYRRGRGAVTSYRYYPRYGYGYPSYGYRNPGYYRGGGVYIGPNNRYPAYRNPNYYRGGYRNPGYYRGGGVYVGPGGISIGW